MSDLEERLPYGGHRRVIWTVEVLDPDDVLVDMEARTAGLAREVAGTAGIVFDDVIEDDRYDNGTHYVQWLLSVPADEHRRQGGGTIPVAVRAVANELERVIDAGPWACKILPDRTWLTGGADRLRDFHAASLAALEVAVLPLRDNIPISEEPMIHAWGEDAQLIIGTYSIRLRAAPPGNVLVDIGQQTPRALRRGGAAASSARKAGLSADTPLLLAPAPRSAPWVAHLAGHGVPVQLWSAPTAAELAGILADELPAVVASL